MNIIHSHILEQRKFRNRTIVCYIEVATRFLEYYYGQPKHKTHRWMLPEHWAKFDGQLEELLKNGELDAESLKERTFYINELISVKIKNSTIPVDILKQCFKNTSEWDSTLALEFLIEYRDNNQCKEEKQRKVSTESENNIVDHHEYEPPFISNSCDNLSVPYTPSVKSYVSVYDKNIFESSDDTNFHEMQHEEPYSPKPVTDSSPNKNSQTPPFPTYKPTQVTHEKSDSVFKGENSPQTEELIENKEYDSNKFKSSKHKAKIKDIDNKNIKNTNDYNEMGKHKNIIDEQNKIRKKDRLKNTTKEREEKCVEESLGNDKDNNDSDIFSNRKSEKRKQKILHSNDDSPQLRPRRSSRSPKKPKRLIDMCGDGKAVTKETDFIPSRNTKNLFGSDYDDDDEIQNNEFDKTCEVNKPTKVQTFVPNTPISSSTESRKKRKLSGKDNGKGNNAIDKWLEKKSTSKVRENKVTSSSSSSSLSAVSEKIKKNKKSTPSIQYLSKEEIAEQMSFEKIQMEKNRLLKEALVKVVGPPPAKVETLSIKNLSEYNVLESFKDYKDKLDPLFQSNSKKVCTIKGHDGINHMLVMSLIDEKIQLKMMNKLRSEYEPDPEEISAYTSLYINALMPEWILCLFMEKHGLTRDKAIQHIKAQEEYNLHLKAKSEYSMSLN